jgi:hypothetical protein
MRLVTRRSGLFVVLVAGLVAAGCSSSSRGPSVSSSTSSSTATTAAPGSGSTPMFGTLASPCGKGSATGATDQGVTNTAIHIAYGDDRGYQATPGLDEEMGDAVKGMIKWCNDQGGINGRPIVGDFYDAAVLQVNTVMQQACKVDFMLVGEGFAEDQAAEQTRVGCNLAQVPGFANGADPAMGPMSYQPVPNPVDLLPMSILPEMAKLFPQDISSFDFMHTSLAQATEYSITKIAAAAPTFGYHIDNCKVVLNYFGEPDYKPFAQKFQTCGAKAIWINAGEGPLQDNFIQAMNAIGDNPIYLGEANEYSPKLAAWNTSGDGNNIYVREAFQPLENASEVPAVQDYLNIVKAVGGKVDQLGEQSASAFLLWATAAKACGSTLTRQCMINDLSKVHTWTGGGLNAPADPGANTPPDCGVIMKLTGTAWSQFYPKALGQFDCDPSYVFHVPSSAWGTTLNAQRLSTKFLGPNVILPQT